MRICTERWTKLAARGRFRFDAKARINNKDYTVISAPRIDRSLMPSPLSVGNCISATLNLSILTDDTITAKSPVVIMGRLTNDKTATEWKEFGTFYIDQRDTSFAGLVTIDCYDAMLKTNQNYLDGSDTAANWPKSMKSVVEEIAYRIGVGIDLRTRIKTGADYVVPYPSGKTMSQVLGYIGACHGGNWIITEENLLRLVPLTTAPDETFHVIDEDYNKITLANGAGNQPVRLAYKEQTIFNAVLPVPSGVLPGSSDNVQRSYFITDEKGNKIVTPEGYYLVWDTDANMAKKVSLQAGVINIPVVCGEITTGTQITVTGVTLNSDSGESYTAGNDNGTMLTIDSNPYATQGICNDLYTAFNGLVYLPFTATKSLYDPATELGDQVKIGELVHSVMFNVKLTLDHNFRADIEAPNSEELSEEYPYLSEVQHLKQTTGELNGAIQNAAKELAGKVDDTALAAEIERAQGVEVALSERIGSEENRAKGAEDGLSKRIKSIEDSSPGALAQRVSTLESTVSGHTQSISALNTAISNHASDISQLVRRVQNAEDDIDALQSTVGGHTTALSEVQGTVTDLQTRLTTAEGTVASHDTAISTLQTKVSNIEAALIDIYTRLNALDSGGTGT